MNEGFTEIIKANRPSVAVIGLGALEATSFPSFLKKTLRAQKLLRQILRSAILSSRKQINYCCWEKKQARVKDAADLRTLERNVREKAKKRSAKNLMVQILYL